MRLFFIIKNKTTGKRKIVDMSDYALIECVDIFRFWKILDRFETKVKLVDENSALIQDYELQNKQAKVFNPKFVPSFLCAELLQENETIKEK